MKRTTKKTRQILVTAVFFFIGFGMIKVQAQSDISEVKDEIISRLSNSQKVYTKDGKYSRILSSKIISDCSIEIWQLCQPLSDGSSEAVSDGACQKQIFIDFSKITDIYWVSTTYGYDMLEIGGSKRAIKIKYYESNSPNGGDTEYSDVVRLTFEDDQLETLFEAWAEYCN